MKTIEQAAGEFSHQSKSKDLFNAFMHGAEFANQWSPIDRDKDGFATTECLDEMFANLPVLVYDAPELHLIQSDNAADWRGEIEQSTDYTHWRPIELPK